MRLSLLEKRESVLDVMLSTLNDFYKGKISFSEYLPKTKEPYLIFYGNKYLNYFGSKLCDSTNFDVVKKEYSNANSFWKKPIQKVLVNLATKPMFYSRLFHYKFYAHGPDLDTISKLLIMGGNTRMRIINALKNETQVILKTGYPDSFIQNEIFYRSTQIKDDFSPKFLRSTQNSFTESLTPGIPINRLDDLKYKSCKNEAFDILKTNYQTVNLKKDPAYINTVVDKISKLLSQHALNDELDLLNKATQDLKRLSIPVSVSHGDYQDANILLTQQGIKVIDWETVGTRSVFYDEICFLANARVSIDKDRLFSVIENIEDKHNLHDIEIFNLFLLEEIEYRLGHISVFKKNKDELITKIKELLYLFQ